MDLDPVFVAWVESAPDAELEARYGLPAGMVREAIRLRTPEEWSDWCRRLP